MYFFFSPVGNFGCEKVSWMFSPLRCSLRQFLLPVLAFVLLCTNAGTAQAQTATGRIIVQSGDAYISYDDKAQTFEIGTNGISRRTAYSPGSGYRLISLKNKLTGREWLAPDGGASAELQMELDGRIISGSARDFVLRGYSTQKAADGSVELEVVMVRGSLVVHLHYASFPGTSILEQWVDVENAGKTGLGNLTVLESFSTGLRPSREPLTLYWVQGLNPPVPDRTKPRQVPTLRLMSVRMTEGIEQVVESPERSSETSMGWFVLAATTLREGMFGGIEWSGAWKLSAARTNDQTKLEAGIAGVSQNLAPGEIFESPRRFVGFYRGNLDSAANASRAFARKFLLRRRPADFPWTQYNTWFAYYTDLDETRLRGEVDAAAALGLEIFYVDAGWYEGSPSQADFSWGLGSWRENRTKFPSGLAAFSDYVHSKGLKFGLWVEPERVDLRYVGPDKEISRDWLSPGTAFDEAPPPDLPQMAQVCLGHREAREWMKGWLSRLVRDYKLDWLKWDNNFWMSCNPPGQPGNADYEHVRGLYEVLDYMRAEFPDLIIEDCASGGNRMDFGLMRRTDIAWLSDETDPSYRVRYHVFGASYPFPPEYLNTWLVESYFEHLADAERDPPLLRSWLRSRMMGAFGISVSIQDWSPEMRSMVDTEIKTYKRIRSILVNSAVYHLLPQSDLTEPELEPPTEPDAAEFYNPTTDSAVIFLFRGAVRWSERRARLRDLFPDTIYTVASADGVISLRRTGLQLMNQSINFPYADNHPSTVLFITPFRKHPSDNFEERP
jgi:alpha-galactosidase